MAGLEILASWRENREKLKMWNSQKFLLSVAGWSGSNFGVGRREGDTTARSTLEESLHDQEWLVHLFEC
jgi:hypothetical protein